MIERDPLKFLAADIKEETKTVYKMSDEYADPSTQENLRDNIRKDKPCWLQHHHDLLLHAIFSYDMDGDLYCIFLCHKNEPRKLSDAFCLLNIEKKIIFK